ncbi:hypothetical protein [Burkholderia ambifaria]|uniref:Uncharacterized protein n=1 Tax=Burkholderia ambifaria MEX-5 TaxID=396597 RepID=B1T2R6_9BURK|nr:hypothetical protein [Burkholderia ambifaria]EDT42145.1 conserved hypothetical protein [Burkholderia ambifaria MEX-5]
MPKTTALTAPRAFVGDPRAQLQAYRTYRAHVIASEKVRHSIEKAWKKESHEIDPWAPQPLPPQGLAYGRLVIEVFRNHARDVIERRTEHATGGTPDVQAFAQRALRIPNDALPGLTRRGHFAQGALYALMPMLWWRRIAVRLRLVGTPQGRKWVFSALTRSLWRRQIYFDAALDFFLRHFSLPDSEEHLEEIGMIGEYVVRSARRIGIGSAAELTEFANACQDLDPEHLAVFTELKVIRTSAELSWFESLRRDGYYSWDKTVANRQAKRSIARLLKLGVPRESTVRLIAFWHRCAPEDLNRSLTALAARGYDNGPEIFEALGETLWRAHKARNWNFVIDTLGAHELPKMALFNHILERDTLPKTAEEVVNALKARGATHEELAQAQNFLLTACDRRADPIRVIALLMAAPHALRVDQLAHCYSYAAQRSEDELKQFLEVLIQHEFGTAAGVLAFGRVYASTIRTSNVGRLLAVYRRMRDTNDDPDAASKWVLEIGEKHLDSFEFLMDALAVSSRAEFQQIRPFARIAKNVLGWAVEGRRYSTVEALRTWRRKARGIEEVKDHDWRNPVTRILLDDAAARGDFVHLDRNCSAFWNAQHDECADTCHRPAAGSDKASYDAYWARVADLKPRLEKRALLHLQHQLDATGGILAASLIRAAWHDVQVYEEQLNQFNEEVIDLLDGRGPKSKEVSELQADAISAVYSLDFRSSLEPWAELSGLDSHLAGLALRPFEMHFERRRVELKPKRKIDPQGINALQEALDYARNFRQFIGIDVGRASDGLSPRQMRENQRASTPQTLVRHLGAILGALPETMCDALSSEVEALGLETHELERRCEAAERIANFFDVELGDALPQSSNSLVEHLNDSARSVLARRLVDTSQDLVLALGQTAQRIREVYGRWIHRQLEAFAGGVFVAGDGHYRAVVSKYGAAYFAKVATKLCSGDNIRMWQERRHAHLLVFDLGRKRLAAMAMIYVEQVAAIDATRPTLIMRAINTVADADSGHSATSIVRAFLAVGEQIAEENKLAALAVPANTDQHLLSNRNDIVTAIMERCSGKSADDYRSNEFSARREVLPRVVRLRADEVFYGYESGRAPANVLHVLWSPTAEVSVNATASATV